MKIRAEIIADARKIRDEITQIFIDSQHWNTHVRKEDESYIDPDPNGDLVNLAMSLDNLLEGETARRPRS